MPVYNQGAPGVRIVLNDNSEVTVTTNPNITAGIVGPSSKGEFNSIRTLTSTAEIDTYLGAGYNSYKYNQALYAARSIITAGGFVEFVRPFGEEVVTDRKDPAYKTNQALKTDSYLVSYDFNAENPADTSLSIGFNAATRYYVDGMTGKGSREIYNIAKAIKEHKNHNFVVNAPVEADSAGTQKKIPLFAIMNTDPTAAVRAGEFIEIRSITGNGSEVTVQTKGTHGLTKDQEVRICGTDTFDTGNDTVKVTYATASTFRYASTIVGTGSTGAVYVNEDTVETGVDYLRVSTVSAGQVSKKVSYIDASGEIADGETASVTFTNSKCEEKTYDIAGVNCDYEVQKYFKNAKLSDVNGSNAAYTNSNFSINLDKALKNDDIDVKFAITSGSITWSKTVTTEVSHDADDTHDEPWTETVVTETQTGTWIDADSGEISVDSFVAADGATTIVFAGTGDEAKDAEAKAADELIITSGTKFSVKYREAAYTNAVLSSEDMKNFEIGDRIKVDSDDAIVTGKAGNEITYDIINGTSVYPKQFTAEETGKIYNYTATLRGLRNAILEDDGSITKSPSTDKSFSYGSGIDEATNEILMSESVNEFSVDDTVFIPGFVNRAETGYFKTSETDTNSGYYKIYAIDYTNNRVTLKAIDGTTPLPVKAYTCKGDVTVADDVVTTTLRCDSGDRVLVQTGTDTTGNPVLTEGVVGSSEVVKTVVGETITINYIITITNKSGAVTPVSGTEIRNLSIEAETDLVMYDVTKANASLFIDNAWSNVGSPKVGDTRLYSINKFEIAVPALKQNVKGLFSTEDAAFTADTSLNEEADAWRTPVLHENIIVDSILGNTFVSLGLATEAMIDINFNGRPSKVYRLTDEGFAVARLFLYVEYMFAGDLYRFSGTVAPMIVNDTNIYIKTAADSIANGWELVMNENPMFEAAVEETDFDLSKSMVEGKMTGYVTKLAADGNDAALQNYAIWSYDPMNNNSSATYQNAWQLFLDKDNAYSDMLVACGTNVKNLFKPGYEEIDYNVIATMLDICEKRKDMYCIFDGVDEPNIDTALRKMISTGNFGDVGRWGAIYDGRSIFRDDIYTRSEVPALKTIEVATIMCLNRAGGQWWLPPAGYTYGAIPGANAVKQKYVRTYNYADDPNSDIARLYDAGINPTRVNQLGQFIYGQKTMLKRTTALNRINCIALVAGVHKRFSSYLDTKTFQLNTAELRANIQTYLQTQLDSITASNPSGLTSGTCICDETNNTPDIIDTNQLIVDIYLQPTRSAEFITLRTTVQRTGDTTTSNTTIIGG